MFVAPMTITEAAQFLGVPRHRVYQVGAKFLKPHQLVDRRDMIRLVKLMRAEDVELRNSAERMPIWKHGAPFAFPCECGTLTGHSDVDRSIPRVFAERDGKRQCPKCGRKFVVAFEDLITQP